MLRSTIALAIAALCWTRSSLGFVPLHGRPDLRQVHHHRRTVLKYSDALLEEQKEQLKMRLPPIDRHTMSKLEIEFRELLEAMLYTPQEMSSITNPRLRAIYEGVAASYWEPAVYRAFEVLYEDYMPLRLAGRMIHGKLQKIMDESKDYQRTQLEQVVSKTGLPLEEVGFCWDRFVNLAGSRELSVDKVSHLFYRSEDLDFFPSSNIMHDDDMEVMNISQRQSLTFEEVVDAWLAYSSDRSAESLKKLFETYEMEEISSSSYINEKQAKYSRRYDDMLVKFGEWKSFIPSGEGRRLDILKGCFVGSENPKVVEALRVIYSDYSALRMSGDWIFQVVSTLMNGTMKRHQRNEA